EYYCQVWGSSSGHPVF
nr:immunoglobulin light chain junction region [Macaca mulatta]